MLLSPTSFQKEWLIWKSSLISSNCPFCLFFSVLINRAHPDSKEKDQRKSAVSWDQLWEIWWLSASLQHWGFCWLEVVNSLKESELRIIFRVQRKRGKWMELLKTLFHSNLYSWAALDTAVSIAKVIFKETESCLTSSHIMEFVWNRCISFYNRIKAACHFSVFETHEEQDT